MKLISLQKTIESLREATSPELCLKRIYSILTEKYHGDRLKTYTHFWEIFIYDAEILWEKSGFLHCTNLNILLRNLLIGSGHFRPEDIRFRWTQIWYFSPHQYTQVRIGREWIDIDVWAHRFGITFGNHAHGFH